MAIRHIRSGEVDTPEEVAKALNRVIDNVNQTEIKLEQLLAAKPTKSDKKKKSDKKGAKDA